MSKKVKICFLVRSLNRGGTESQLVLLLKSIPKENYDISLITFYHHGELFSELLGDDRIRIIRLGKRNRWDLLFFGYRLIKSIRELRPDIIQSYLETANIASVLLKLFFPNIKTIWGIRTSEFNYTEFDTFTGLAWEIQFYLSHFTDCIVTNSNKALSQLSKSGFPFHKLKFIPNGIDTSRFLIDRELGSSFKTTLGITPDAPIVGIVARIDPLKDYPLFLQSCGLLLSKHPKMQILCVGTQPSEQLDQLKSLAESLNIQENLHWLSNQSNMLAVYNSLNVLVSSSKTEGFSNVIAEAMACGVQCVVTDTGDSSLIVGSMGKVASPSIPDVLAARIDAIFLETEGPSPMEIRNRILENFGLPRLVESNLSLFDSLILTKD